MSGADRRRQLLEVALEVFGAHGFHDTSMEEIAERAGVTKPVLYQHFSSKQQLFVELVRSVGDDLATAVTAAADAASLPRDKVLAGFRAYFSWVAARPAAFQLLFGAAGGAGAGDIVAGFEDRMAEAVAALIEGELDPTHRRLLADSIVGLAEVVSRRWVGVEPGEVLARRLADLTWAGLRGIHRDHQTP